MNKKQVIERINSIIEKHGPFTTADVEATSSPVIRMHKNTSTLAERFDRGQCEGFDYVHETETGSDFYDYEGLEAEVLDEIMFLAEDWEVICEKTQKRCSN